MYVFGVIISERNIPRSSFLQHCWMMALICRTKHISKTFWGFFQWEGFQKYAGEAGSIWIVRFNVYILQEKNCLQESKKAIGTVVESMCTFSWCIDSKIWWLQIFVSFVYKINTYIHTYKPRRKLWITIHYEILSN